MRIVFQKNFGPFPAEITVPCLLASKPRKGEIVLVYYKEFLVALRHVEKVSRNSYTFKTTSEEK